jgi:hypothetical protein
MRALRTAGIALTLAAALVTAVIVLTGGSAADAASGHSRAPQAGHVDGVVGTVTYSGHGDDTLIAGTTVPPGPDGGCSASTRYQKTTDTYSLSGHYSGQLGSVRPRTKVRAKLLGLEGTSGCDTTGQAGTAFACTATPTIAGSELAEVSGGRVRLSVYTLIQPGPERATDGEPCVNDVFEVPLVPNAAYLEVGGTFAFPLAQIEKTRRVSVTLNSRRAANCVGSDLALPAKATVCVDGTNAKNARCDAFAAPAGGSASCATTNSWVEKITFRLSRVLSEG